MKDLMTIRVLHKGNKQMIVGNERIVMSFSLDNSFMFGIEWGFKPWFFVFCFAFFRFFIGENCLDFDAFEEDLGGPNNKG